MPYQVYANPNLIPELMTQGGSALAAGISSGIAQFARQAEEAMKEQKNLAAQAKAFRSLNKSLREDQRPIDEHTAANMSSRDIVEFGKQYFAQQGMEDREQQRAERAARIKEYDSQGKAREAERQARDVERANEALVPRWAAEVARYRKAPDAPWDEWSDEEVGYSLPEGQAAPGIAEYVKAGRATGYQLPPKEMFEMLSRRPGMSAEEGMRIAGSLGGQVTINPNGTSSVTLPAAPSTSTTATPILGENGRPTGKARLPDGRIIDLDAPPKVPSELHRVLTEHARRVEGNTRILDDPKSKPSDVARAKAFLAAAPAQADVYIRQYEREISPDDAAAFRKNHGVAGPAAPARKTATDANGNKVELKNGVWVPYSK